MKRTVGDLLHVVTSLAVESNPRYQRRDVTGDGVPETFCNYFVRDALRALDVHVPPMLVNDLYDWLRDVGPSEGWTLCGQATAAFRASLGFPTVAAVKAAGHGHIALLVPPRTLQGTWIAQAGRTNFSHGSLASGFGQLAPTFFTHD